MGISRELGPASHYINAQLDVCSRPCEEVGDNL